MSSVTRGHRLYFAAVCALALLVGLRGFFTPGQVDAAIPWLVPPLHARFLGAMYLSGATFMIGCLFARRWSEVRVVVPMIAIWTGTLFLVSLLHLSEFDLARRQSWVWFAAYLVYPLIAAWLTWRMRAADPAGMADAADTADPARMAAPPHRLPAWLLIYLRVQGIVMTLLALALLLVPARVVPVWPWKLPLLLGQLYAAPFLSYGIGSLLLARERTWPQVRIAVVAMWVFALAVLCASLIHRALFSVADGPDVLWFAAFGAATVALGMATLTAGRGGQAEPHPGSA